MWGLKVTGVTYEFDTEGYNKALRDNIEKQAKLAARKFATVALARIPVRTGFVSGAFSTLTDLVGGGARLNPVIAFTRRVLSAARNFLSGQRSAGEYYYPPGGGRVLKSAVSGRQFATPTKDIFSWQGDTFTFKYAIDITYFRVNDATNTIPSAPWGAFVAAEAAFEAHMQEALINPDVKLESFIKEKRI